MVFDLKAAEKCLKVLQSCRYKSELLCDGIRGIYRELCAEESKEMELLSGELGKRLSELEEQVSQIKALMIALDGIISIYEKTEQKNIARIEGIHCPRKDLPRWIDILNTVPSDIAELFR